MPIEMPDETPIEIDWRNKMRDPSSNIFTPQEVIDDILADEYAVWVVLTQEAITEPHGIGQFRALTEKVTSKRQPLYWVLVTISYVNPPSSPAWGAESGRGYKLEEI